MKLHALFSSLALGAANLLIAPVHAQTLTRCEVYVCMAGISGVGLSGGPACVPAIAYWHAPSPAGLAVWTPYGFIAPASYALRQTYLTTGCPASIVATNAAVLTAIMVTWGSEP